jgi:hypothetical protein
VKTALTYYAQFEGVSSLIFLADFQGLLKRKLFSVLARKKNRG